MQSIRAGTKKKKRGEGRLKNRKKSHLRSAKKQNTTEEKGCTFKDMSVKGYRQKVLKRQGKGGTEGGQTVRHGTGDEQARTGPTPSRLRESCFGSEKRLGGKRKIGERGGKGEIPSTGE